MFSRKKKYKKKNKIYFKYIGTEIQRTYFLLCILDTQHSSEKNRFSLYLSPSRAPTSIPSSGRFLAPGIGGCNSFHANLFAIEKDINGAAKEWGRQIKAKKCERDQVRKKKRYEWPRNVQILVMICLCSSCFCIPLVCGAQTWYFREGSHSHRLYIEKWSLTMCTCKFHSCIQEFCPQFIPYVLLRFIFLFSRISFVHVCVCWFVFFPRCLHFF